MRVGSKITCKESPLSKKANRRLSKPMHAIVSDMSMHRSVVGKKLPEHAELRLHELFCRDFQFVGQIPIRVRTHIIARGHTILFATGHKLFHHIFSVRRMHDRVVGKFRVPKAEASLVVGCQTDFFGPKCDGCLDPLVRGQIGGVESGGGNALRVASHAIVLD